MNPSSVGERDGREPERRVEPVVGVRDDRLVAHARLDDADVGVEQAGLAVAGEHVEEPAAHERVGVAADDLGRARVDERPLEVGHPAPVVADGLECHDAVRRGGEDRPEEPLRLAGDPDRRAVVGHVEERHDDGLGAAVAVVVDGRRVHAVPPGGAVRRRHALDDAADGLARAEHLALGEVLGGDGRPRPRHTTGQRAGRSSVSALAVDVLEAEELARRRVRHDHTGLGVDDDDAGLDRLDDRAVALAGLRLGRLGAVEPRAAGPRRRP